MAFFNEFDGHVRGKYGLADHNDNGRRFVDLFNFNRVLIGGTLFEYRAWSGQVSWVGLLLKIPLIITPCIGTHSPKIADVGVVSRALDEG